MVNSDLASTRTALISRLRKEEDPVIREHLSSTLKLLEVRQNVENQEHAGRVDRYLTWHIQHLSAPHGEGQ
jgi:hypothetical protein